MIAALWTLFTATRVGKALPSWVWELILIALAAIAGLTAHHIAVIHHDNSVRAEQKAADEKQAQAIIAKINGRISKIVAPIRSKTDEQATAIHGDADALRVSGPGKARCPVLPAAASGPQQSPAKPDVAGPSLPPADFAAVPWSWLTDRAEEHDQLLNENKAWRDWYSKIVAAWPKSNK